MDPELNSSFVDQSSRRILVDNNGNLVNNDELFQWLLLPNYNDTFEPPATWCDVPDIDNNDELPELIEVIDTTERRRNTTNEQTQRYINTLESDHETLFTQLSLLVSAYQNNRSNIHPNSTNNHMEIFLNNHSVSPFYTETILIPTIAHQQTLQNIYITDTSFPLYTTPSYSLQNSFVSLALQQNSINLISDSAHPFFSSYSSFPQYLQNTDTFLGLPFTPLQQLSLEHECNFSFNLSTKTINRLIPFFSRISSKNLPLYFWRAASSSLTSRRLHVEFSPSDTRTFRILSYFLSFKLHYYYQSFAIMSNIVSAAKKQRSQYSIASPKRFSSPTTPKVSNNSLYFPDFCVVKMKPTKYIRTVKASPNEIAHTGAYSLRSSLDKTGHLDYSLFDTISLILSKIKEIDPLVQVIQVTDNLQVPNKRCIPDDITEDNVLEWISAFEQADSNNGLKLDRFSLHFESDVEFLGGWLYNWIRPKNCPHVLHVTPAIVSVPRAVGWILFASLFSINIENFKTFMNENVFGREVQQNIYPRNVYIDKRNSSISDRTATMAYEVPDFEYEFVCAKIYEANENIFTGVYQHLAILPFKMQRFIPEQNRCFTRQETFNTQRESIIIKTFTSEPEDVHLNLMEAMMLATHPSTGRPVVLVGERFFCDLHFTVHAIDRPTALAVAKKFISTHTDTRFEIIGPTSAQLQRSVWNRRPSAVSITDSDNISVMSGSTAATTQVSPRGRSIKRRNPSSPSIISTISSPAQLNQAILKEMSPFTKTITARVDKQDEVLAQLVHNQEALQKSQNELEKYSLNFAEEDAKHRTALNKVLNSLERTIEYNHVSAQHSISTLASTINNNAKGTTSLINSLSTTPFASSLHVSKFETIDISGLRVNCPMLTNSGKSNDSITDAEDASNTESPSFEEGNMSE